MKTPWPYPSGRAAVRIYFVSNLLFVTGSVLFFLGCVLCLSVYFVWYLAAGRNVTLDGILAAGGYLTGSCLFVLTDLIGAARRK